jgi:tetrahydromethanopterin S-methyltransferase subunit D
MTKPQQQEGRSLAVTLLVSILLGCIPLAGIGWIMVTRAITTVDGLFTSLILLTLSGIFFLNAFLELRDLGFLAFLQKKKAGPPKEPPASKAG